MTMAQMKKYFKSKAAAKRVAAERNGNGAPIIGVFKMPKGSRHAGMFAVCSYLEWLNTY